MAIRRICNGYSRRRVLRYYYGFPVCAVGTIRHSEVFLWGPVEDSRTLIAVSFQAWLAQLSAPPPRPSA